jgi:hypothetical protein
MHDWEVKFVTSFFHTQYSCRMGRKGEDKLCWILFFLFLFLFFFMTRNPSKAGPLRIPTLVKQTSDPCKVPPPHKSDNTPASPAGWPQEIVCTQVKRLLHMLLKRRFFEVKTFYKILTRRSLGRAYGG